MKVVLWGIKYVLRHHLSERRVPLICGLVLTNQCNLGCRQCRIATRGDKHLSFQETRDAIASFYEEGGRCLYLQGGEPFLWRDKRHGIEDIVEYAHGIGFFTVIIYTKRRLPPFWQLGQSCDSTIPPKRRQTSFPSFPEELHVRRYIEGHFPHPLSHSPLPGQAEGIRGLPSAAAYRPLTALR